MAALRKPETRRSSIRRLRTSSVAASPLPMTIDCSTAKKLSGRTRTLGSRAALAVRGKRVNLGGGKHLLRIVDRHGRTAFQFRLLERPAQVQLAGVALSGAYPDARTIDIGGRANRGVRANEVAVPAEGVGLREINLGGARGVERKKADIRGMTLDGIEDGAHTWRGRNPEGDAETARQLACDLGDGAANGAGLGVNSALGRIVSKKTRAQGSGGGQLGSPAR